ncbi:MAG: LysR family transcriptional regulator [Myxococcota bacterium]
MTVLSDDGALHLADINLNLLVALDAVLDADTVTAAARRIGVTQSAMSHSLRQLRQLLDDPLLVRGAGGLVPTPRAQSLRLPIRRALLDLQHALRTPPSFEPATAKRRFRVGAGDYIAYTMLPTLAETCAATSGIELDVVPFLPVDRPRLSTGEIDLGIAAFVPPLPGVRRAPVLTDQFACLVRRGHPKVRRRLTLRQFLRLPHVLISPTGRGTSQIDTQLRSQGLERRIAIRIRYFLAAAMVVSRSDLVLTAPRRLGELFAEHFAVELHEPPIELAPLTLEMLWHERYEADPAHRWLREQIRATSGDRAA